MRVQMADGAGSSTAGTPVPRTRASHMIRSQMPKIAGTTILLTTLPVRRPSPESTVTNRQAISQQAVSAA